MCCFYDIFRILITQVTSYGDPIHQRTFCDLVDRILIYKNKDLSYVSEPDLQLALTRLDMDQIKEKDVNEYIEKLSGINLKILLPLGEFVQDEEGMMF